MKLSVTQWTDAQDNLDQKTLNGKLLWHLIERRTYGKQWSAEVGIGLSKDDDATVRAALDAGQEGRADG